MEDSALLLSSFAVYIRKAADKILHKNSKRNTFPLFVLLKFEKSTRGMQISCRKSGEIVV